MALDLLWEDDHLLAANKPAGIVVHPTYKHAFGTLLDALRAYAADWPASRNPTIVGRLDRLTSGVVVVAKHADAHAALQRTPMDKDYLAIVIGEVDEASGEIDLRLRVDPADRRRVIASPTVGRASVTRFERLACGPGLTLLRCRLATGRRHQIRAHLAARGWPLVGDPIYGAWPGAHPEASSEPSPTAEEASSSRDYSNGPAPASEVSRAPFPDWRRSALVPDDTCVQRSASNGLSSASSAGCPPRADLHQPSPGADGTCVRNGDSNRPTRATDVSGDTLAETIRGFPRQALHAWRVAFTHPITGAAIRLEAPPPADLRQLLHACGWASFG